MHLSLPAIRAQHVGKTYVVREVQKNFALRAAFADATGKFFSTFRRKLPRDSIPHRSRIFDALSDVSFDIAAGESVGLIGRNGAGKSTLLKILSGIVRPSSGRIELYGRIGSLLEVGTGFHPELTGRENVFLNGAIIGMSANDIRRKFDDIVSFAGVEKFIDTPIKHFSTGMHMRLAFAVAAELDPEILLIDEVLAVGDASFQKKCLGRMNEVSREGRTVVFVSHDMTAITRLCRRAILLDQGRVIADGPSGNVTAQYLNSDLGTKSTRLWRTEAAPGDDVARLLSISVLGDDRVTREIFDIQQSVIIEIIWEVMRTGYAPIPNMQIHNDHGICLFATSDTDPQWTRENKIPGTYSSQMTIPANFLNEGLVIIDIAVTSLEPLHVHVYERQVASFQIVDNLEGSPLRGEFAGVIPGAVRPWFKWQTMRTHSGK